MRRLFLDTDESSSAELSRLREAVSKRKENTESNISTVRPVVKAKSIDDYKKKITQHEANKSLEKDQTRDFKENIKKESNHEETSVD